MNQVSPLASRFVRGSPTTSLERWRHGEGSVQLGLARDSPSTSVERRWAERGRSSEHLDMGGAATIPLRRHHGQHRIRYCVAGPCPSAGRRGMVDAPGTRTPRFCLDVRPAGVGCRRDHRTTGGAAWWPTTTCSTRCVSPRKRPPSISSPTADSNSASAPAGTGPSMSSSTSPTTGRCSEPPGDAILTLAATEADIIGLSGLTWTGSGVAPAGAGFDALAQRVRFIRAHAPDRRKSNDPHDRPQIGPQRATARP